MTVTRLRMLTIALAAFAFLTGFGTSAAIAQSAFWNTAATTGGSWGTAANWQGGTVPSGAGNAAGFVLDFTPGATVTLDGDRVIGTIISTGANSWNLAPGVGPGTLSVANITVTGGPMMVSTPLLGVNFAKDGSGALSFTNPNANYSGTININAGTLSLIGSGNFSINSNVVHLASGTTLDVTQLTSGLRFGGIDTRLNVQNGDLLNGTGEVKGGLKVKSGGTVYPGDNGVGTLNVDGKGLFEAGSNWSVKLGSANAGASNTNNLLTFTAGLELENGMNMPIDGSGLSFAAGQTFDYLISTGASSFNIGAVNFQPINFAPGMNPLLSDFSLFTNGDHLTLRYVTPVPEPSSLLFAGIGIAAGYRVLRRRLAR